jgi:hypothetical protein
MRKHVLVLTTSVAIFAYGTLAASGQTPATEPAPLPGSPSSVVPNVQPSSVSPIPQPPSAAAPVPQPSSAAAPVPKPATAQLPQPAMGYPRGRMGPVYNPCIGPRGPVGPCMMHGRMLRMMFALMDADGDGERIFKAMDSNKDGFVTPQEMRNFLRGTSTPFPSPRE